MLYDTAEQHADDIVTYLHAKITCICFTFVLVIVNPIIFDYSRFLIS